MDFELLKAEIEKKISKLDTYMDTLDNSDVANVTEWIPTPSLDLNRILSGSLFKGLPNRSITTIAGPEHTMKSSFMIICMAEAQKMGYTPVIIDTEGGVKGDFCKRWGLDPSKAIYHYEPWLDNLLPILTHYHDVGAEKLFFGIDSLGVLDKLKLLDDSRGGDTKADMGMIAKEIKRMMKILSSICMKWNSLAIVTGHMYSATSGVPMPDQIGGGKGPRYLSSILISLKKKKIQSGAAKDSPVIGSEIKATTMKNRFYPPFQNATISIDYNTGFDKYAGLMDICESAGIVEKSGAWYKFPKYNENYQGELNARQVFTAHPEILQDLDDFLKVTGYSTVNEEAKELIETIESEGVEKSEKKEESTDKPIRVKKKK